MVTNEGDITLVADHDGRPDDRMAILMKRKDEETKSSY